MQCTNFFVRKKENLDMNQVRLLRCGILPPFSPGFVAFPGSPAWLPVFVWLLLRIRGFCDIEFENSAQQQPVWSPMSFVFFLFSEFISRLDALHTVLNSLYMHTLPMSKLHQQNRFIFVGS